MAFDQALAEEKLLQWEDGLKAYRLPSWEDLPALPLYMDQVIYLLNEYLALFSVDGGEDKQVTPAMVNNYVKSRLLPAPVKKRYGRMHLACLIMICLLKQSMNTGDIPRVLASDASEGEMREAYTAFTAIYHSAAGEHVKAVQEAAAPVKEGKMPLEHLIFRLAAQANLSRQLAAKLLRLEDDREEKQDHE
ncbi:MAG: DUF1836 domain-containing protein [Clostridiales bacterium]|nr:DUF1836 domain-containing protein [Clostridiales bacterium]